MSQAAGTWIKRPENIWLLFSFGLGVVNFFLVLLLWNVSGAEPKLDNLAVSLTVLEIFLAVIAVSGFFLIRSAAVKAAEEEARAEAGRLAPIVARRAAVDYLSLLQQKNGSKPVIDLNNELMQSLDSNEEDPNAG